MSEKLRKLETAALATIGIIRGLGELALYEVRIKKSPQGVSPANIQIMEGDSVKK